MKVLDSFEVGWQYAKKHGWLLTLVMFIMSIVIFYLTMACYPDGFVEEYMKVVKSGNIAMVQKLVPYIEAATSKLWVVNILQFMMFAGVINVALAKYEGLTEKVDLRYLSLPFMTYVKLVGLFCMYMVLLMLSTPTFGISLFYFGTRLLFVLPVLLDDPNVTFYEAMTRSWKITRGNFWKTFGFLMLCLLLIFIGFCFLLLGTFFASVICIYALCNLYKAELSKGES